MLIVFQKDSEAPRHLHPLLCLAFFRAFRRELWRIGVCRDPKAGDCVLGVRIVSLSI